MAIPSIASIFSGYKANKVYSVLPTDGTGDLDFTRASSATRIAKSGLIETLATGVPRLDYTGGGCPSLLLEPQSTNLAINSISYASWTQQDLTLTLNTVIAPDGQLTGSTILATGSNCQLQYAHSGTTGLVYTTSFYLKRKTGTGQINLRSVENTNTPITITNEWEKYSVTTTSTSTSIRIGVDFETIGDEIYIWNGQLEEQPYATSPIITGAAIATRLADKAFKTGLSSYINSVEGSFEINCKLLGNQTDSVRFSLSDGTTGNRISLAFTSTNITVFSILNSSGNANNIDHNYSFTDFTDFKVTWTSTLISLFISNVEVATSAITTPFTSNLFNRIGLDTGNDSANFLGRVREIKIYK